MTPQSAPNRISIGADGLGEISDAQIEKRARELARTEGRDAVSEADRRRAVEEMTNQASDPVPPEAVEPGIDQLVSWDEPPDSTGHRATRVLPEDELNIGEQLVQEGLEEAEHDIRVSAAEDPEKSSLGE